MNMPFLLYPDRQMFPEGEKGKKHNYASDILVVEPTLVQNADGTDDRTSPASTRSEELIDSKGQIHPLVDFNRLRLAACMNLQQQHATTGVSKKTLQLLLAGWSKGTYMVYQSIWKHWSSWCQRREADPISCEIQPFL